MKLVIEVDDDFATDDHVFTILGKMRESYMKDRKAGDEGGYVEIDGRTAADWTPYR